MLPAKVMQTSGSLPTARLYSMSISDGRPSHPSEMAQGPGFHRRDFVRRKPEQQLADLKDLHASNDLVTLKSLLRVTKITLDPELTKLLLDEAVRRRDEDLACLTISKGKNADSTVSLVLTVNRQQDMIDYFLALGADIKLDDHKGEPSSLRIACDYRDIELIKLLLNHDEMKWIVLLQQLLRKLQHCYRPTGTPTASNNEGYGGLLRTLLHIAVTRHMAEREESFKKIVQWLIDNGCHPLATNNAGLTPYQYGRTQRILQENYPVAHR
ncbi:hypothetical protein TSTA_110240 [Talaromyces stipitatus ATCC 10500]|uniref:Uncharacterized protein n=1 Tax=Talaromyces stipitatus (strain ATCC 10500 / CBS 375.48 / QM 6759 / NRRL 1006) TaxID=441959 RepID=B8MUH2_TALSN|nr:uncharacterized protein TSTA_110240 [Talaromyces stipitatus ATCC 10500]EED11844.1 hypothetical protein TSTA_110240 [Talaromyces stipitatus ATCC 10500]